MDYPKQSSISLYDYSDKSIPQAGYATIVYSVVYTLSTAAVWFRAPNTPLAAVIIAASIIIVFFGTLAFGIFRKSRIAVITILVFVVGIQLYTWFIARSITGTILSVVVTGFLLRGARRIFQYHVEREEAEQRASARVE
ncbi:MAG: hypothetical protein QOC70_1533 [Verrucomicrobiota bacterium]|jgi:hypothetical protein